MTSVKNTNSVFRKLGEAVQTFEVPALGPLLAARVNENLLQSYAASHKSLDTAYRQIGRRWKLWRLLAWFLGVTLAAVGIITTLDGLLGVFDVGLGALIANVWPIAKMPIGLVLCGLGYWVSTRTSKLFQSKLIDRARQVLDELLFTRAMITVHKLATAVEAAATYPWPHDGMPLEELVDVMADTRRWMLVREQAGTSARSLPATLTPEKQQTLREILEEPRLGRGLRLSSAIILGRCGDESVLPLLEETLQAVQKPRIRAPLQLLCELDDSQLVTQSVQYFHVTDRDDDLYANVRLDVIERQVLDGLGYLQSESAASVLRQYLAGPDHGVWLRHIALQALGRQGTPAAVDALGQLFLGSAGKDHDSLDQLAAVDSPAAVEQLLNLLNTPVGQKHARWIFRLLVRSHQALVIDRLLGYFKSQDRAVARSNLSYLKANTDTSYQVLTRLVTDDVFDCDLRWQALKILVRYAKMPPVKTALQLWHETPKTGTILDQTQYDVMALIDTHETRQILIEPMKHVDQDLCGAIRAVIGLAHAGIQGRHILEQRGADPATNQTVRVLTHAALLAQNHPSGQSDLVLGFLRDSHIPEGRRKDILEVFDHAFSLSSVSASMRMLELIAGDQEMPTPITQAAANAAQHLEAMYPKTGQATKIANKSA